MKNICALLVLLAILNGCVTTQSTNSQTNGNHDEITVPSSSEGSTQSRKKLALLVGIDDYLSDKVSDLGGCVNDVMDMKQLLISKFDFDNKDIRILKDKQATHKGIVKAFQDHLIKKAEKDAIVVFHYSGHGSQMIDALGDKGDENDGYDETIVPYDSRTQDIFDISDDELNGLFTMLTDKTDNVTFILDSCHSGTGTRGLGRVRFVMPDERIPPPAQDYALSTRSIDKTDERLENHKYVLISGCRADELSYELRGKKRGALSYYLTKEIRNSGKASLTYRDIMDQVKAMVTAENGTQHPQLEGAGMDNYVFSDKFSLAKAHILASPDGDSVIFDAGHVHGFTRGSKFDIYEPGTKDMEDSERAIAHVELTEVAAYSSKAKYAKPPASGKILRPSPAIEREHAHPKSRFPICFDNLTNSVVLQKIKGKIEDNPHYMVVEECGNAQLLLKEEQGKVQISGCDGVISSPAISINESSVVERTIEQIANWAKWFNVLSIENPQSNMNVSFSIERADSRRTRGPITIGNPELTLEDGQNITLTAENTGSNKFYFAILDLSSDGSISTIYPPRGVNDPLVPDSEPWEVNTETFVPEELTEVRDILKLIVTEEPVDFSILEQEATRELDGSRELDGLTALLADSVMKSRGAKPVRMNVDNWTTRLAVFEVVKKRQQ